MADSRKSVTPDSQTDLDSVSCSGLTEAQKVNIADNFHLQVSGAVMETNTLNSNIVQKNENRAKDAMAAFRRSAAHIWSDVGEGMDIGELINRAKELGRTLTDVMNGKVDPTEAFCKATGCNFGNGGPPVPRMPSPDDPFR